MKQIVDPASPAPVGEADLERFDLNLLRVLDALLDAGSVSAAARRLRLSQPATSAALSRLRASLGDPLLVRRGNRMVPTPLAEELQPRLSRILADIRGTLGSAGGFDPARTGRRFRIGANDYATLVLLAPLAARLRRLAPRATVEIRALAEQPDDALANRDLDMVVGGSWTLRGLRDPETLFRETFLCVARADHPRLSERVTLEEFVAEDHALIASGNRTRGDVDVALDSLGRKRRVALTLPHYLAAPAVIAHTDMVMTMPRRVAEGLGGVHHLRTFAPPLALEGFDVVMASHPRNEADPSVQWLRRLTREVSASLKADGAGEPENRSR